MIFVDSSALLALISAGDQHHLRAKQCFKSLREERKILITNNYVIVESISLMQKRFDLDEVRDFQEKILPLIQIEWIDEERHNNSIQRVLSAHRRRLSLVDCSAFETMRRRGIETAFTFDPHFREEGFRVIP